jgi:hypothetical protein
MLYSTLFHFFLFRSVIHGFLNMVPLVTNYTKWSICLSHRHTSDGQIWRVRPTHQIFLPTKSFAHRHANFGARQLTQKIACKITGHPTRTTPHVVSHQGQLCTFLNPFLLAEISYMKVSSSTCVRHHLDITHDSPPVSFHPRLPLVVIVISPLSNTRHCPHIASMTLSYLLILMSS